MSDGPEIALFEAKKLAGMCRVVAGAFDASDQANFFGVIVEELSQARDEALQITKKGH